MTVKVRPRRRRREGGTTSVFSCMQIFMSSPGGEIHIIFQL
jgi:hypothetical protein